MGKMLLVLGLLAGGCAWTNRNAVEADRRNAEHAARVAEHDRYKHACLVTAYDTSADPRARAECLAWLEEDRAADVRAAQGRQAEQEAARERSARAAAGLRAFGASMQNASQQSVNCTSNRLGSTVYTNCR
jgi:hypothetical protein